MTQAQYYIRMCMILCANIACILLSFRRGRRENLRMILACAGIFLVRQLYVEITGDPINLTNFMPGFAFLPSLYFIHKGSVAQKVFVVGIVLAMCHLILIAASFLAMGSVTRGIVLLGVALAAYIALMAWRGHKLTQRVFDSAQGSWWGYAAYISVFYLIMIQAYGLNIALPENPADLRFFYLLPAFALAGLLLFFITVLRTHEKTAANLELGFSRSLIDAASGYYQQIDALHSQIHIQRHDMKYSLTVLDKLLQEDDRAELGRYLGEVAKRLEETAPREYCGNSVVNVLLLSYAERCRAHNITFDAAVYLPEELSIPNYELCIVVGNLLENAVEACLKLEDKRRIELLVKPLGGQLVLKAANAYNGEGQGDSPAEENALPASTKKNGGLGLRSVRAVAEKYKGELMINQDGVTFTAYVTLEG